MNRNKLHPLDFVLIDITRTFTTSSTVSSHSILMNAMKTFSSNEVDLQFHHDESTSIQTQFSLINKNKEDLKKPIKELIIFLGVLSIVLSILYVASYVLLSTRYCTSFVLENLNKKKMQMWKTYTCSLVYKWGQGSM